MGIIDPIIEQYQSDETQMKMDVIPLLKELVSTSFHRTWETRESAERHLELLGSKATEAFVKHAAAQDLIEKYDPEWVRLMPPFEIEANLTNGTIKLKE